MTAPPFRGIYPMLYAFFGGAHGIAVLGLATEVGKLSPAERADALSWTAEALASRLPLAVTIAEATIEKQVDAAHAARDQGAA